MEDVNTTLQISFSLSGLGCGHLHLRFNASRNIRDNVWNKAKSCKEWRSRFGAFVVVKALYTWNALQQFLHSATVWPYQSVLFCEQEVNTQLIFLSALIRPTTEEEDGGLLSNNNSIFFYFSGTLKMSQQLLRRLRGYSKRSMYYYLFISSLKHFSQCIRFCGCEA